MKNLLRVAKIFPSIVLLASCHSSHKTVVMRPAPSRTVVVVQQPQSQPQSLPPGQAKKVYGSQSAKPFAPGQQKKQVVNVYPLIIVRTSAMVVYAFSDGRHYHRNGDGMIYWLGKDDRFYLDDSYISKVKYDDKEYNEWKEKKDHGDKGKNKQEISNSKEKEKGNKDNHSSSSNDHGDKIKNKEETSNSKQKEKGNKDNNSSSSKDQKKTKENKDEKG